MPKLLTPIFRTYTSDATFPMQSNGVDRFCHKCATADNQDKRKPGFQVQSSRQQLSDAVRQHQSGYHTKARQAIGELAQKVA